MLMPDVQNTCPEATYLTKSNIAHPSTREAHVAAAEARARAELTQREGVTVSGGAILRRAGTA